MQASNNHRRNETHERKALQYLEATEDHYFFDEASGIYKKKPNETGRQQERPGYDKHKPFWAAVKRDWLAIGVSTLTLLLLAATVIFARRQWKAIDKQFPAITKSADAAQTAAEAASDQLHEIKSADRAFIFVQKVSVASLRTGVGLPTLTWTVDVVNSGTTQAKHLMFTAACAPGIGGKDPLDLKSLGRPVPMFVGPKSTLSIINCSSSPEVVHSTPFGYFVFGRITYNDVFGDNHLTEFCWQYVRFSEEISGEGMLQCAQYNCADEECKDFSRSDKLSPHR